MATPDVPQVSQICAGGARWQERVIEMRHYNGAIEGFDTDVIYKVVYALRTQINDPTKTDPVLYITGGTRHDGQPNNWMAHMDEIEWLTRWYPQVVADYKDDGVVGWNL